MVVVGGREVVMVVTVVLAFPTTQAGKSAAHACRVVRHTRIYPNQVVCACPYCGITPYFAYYPP